jgi:hypothetical protein
MDRNGRSRLDAGACCAVWCDIPELGLSARPTMGRADNHHNPARRWGLGSPGLWRDSTCWVCFCLLRSGSHATEPNGQSPLLAEPPECRVPTPAGMGVEVVGDLAHHRIQEPLSLADALVGHNL